MDKKSISEKIIRLKKRDEALRSELINKGIFSDGYNPEMEALHNRNARELSQIMETIGYPTCEKIGKEASDAAWLIV